MSKHVVCDSRKQVMECLHCGDTAPIPLGKISYVCAAMDGFEKAHRGCLGVFEVEIDAGRIPAGPVAGRMPAGPVLKTN